jgi:hypothetical protein
MKTENFKQSKFGKELKIGYCPYHPKHKLDGKGECDLCEAEIMQYQPKQKTCPAPARCKTPETCTHKALTCFCPYRAVTV